ncbi:MAG: hypothetical protein [Inoviridae sp.]|nr:MAG: hypothetical protein [Inoviridae sp.]
MTIFVMMWSKIQVPERTYSTGAPQRVPKPAMKLLAIFGLITVLVISSLLNIALFNLFAQLF